MFSRSSQVVCRWCCCCNRLHFRDTFSACNRFQFTVLSMLSRHTLSRIIMMACILCCQTSFSLPSSPLLPWLRSTSVDDGCRSVLSRSSQNFILKCTLYFILLPSQCNRCTFGTVALQLWSASALLFHLFINVWGVHQYPSHAQSHSYKTFITK